MPQKSMRGGERHRRQRGVLLLSGETQEAKQEGGGDRRDMKGWVRKKAQPVASRIKDGVGAQ
jgi:hypothetical protein